MKARIFAAIALVVGIGVGMVLSPFGPTNVQAAKRRTTFVYRCLADDTYDDLGTVVYITNLGSEAATITTTVYSTGGTPFLPSTFTANAKETKVLSTSDISLVEIRSKARLLVDGLSRFSNGAEPTIHRQIRCS